MVKILSILGIAIFFAAVVLNPFTALAQQSVDIRAEIAVEKSKRPAIVETVEYQNPLEKLAEYLGPRKAFVGGSGHEHYRNVDEILAGTSCENIHPDLYSDKVANGKSIVFFYSNNSEVSKRLAQVFYNLDSKIRGKIKLYKFNDQEHPSFSKQLGVEDIPSFFFYNNGKIVFKHNRGPKEGRVQAWTSQMEKAINKYLL